MKISIDLDDTILVRHDCPFKEPNTTALNRGPIKEYFRAGTRSLFQFLETRNLDVGIYTNSYRGKSDLENWFQENSFKISFVINQQLHDARIDQEDNRYSLPDKCPHLFGIDIHIDDLPEIKEDSERFGTKVILAYSGEDWVEKIITQLKAFKQ